MRKTNSLVYNIPDLSIKDIIQYFNDFEINIKQSDIIKPTHQFVIRLYENILKTYTNEVPTFLNQIECSPISTDESTSLIMLYKKLYNFLSKIGLDTFNLKDLYPDSKRLISILSVVINFSMYRDSKKYIYERIYKVGEERSILRKDIENKINQKCKEINKFKSEIKVNNSNKINIEKEISELEHELKEAINIQKSLVSEIEKLKIERDDNNDKLNSYQLLVMNTKQDITGLKTQIISDPSKLMLLLKEMRELVNKERESLREIEKSKNEYNMKIEYFTKSIDEIKRIIKLTLEIKEEEECIKEIEKSIENVELEISSIESSISVSKIRMNYLNRQISHLESKLYNLQDSDRVCSESIFTKMNDLKNSYETITEQRLCIKNKIDENIKTSKSIEKEIIKVKTEYENDINEIINILYNIKDKNMSMFTDIKKYFT